MALFIPTQIVQTPEHIVLWTEDVQGARIVPMSRPSLPAIPQYEGRPFARWDGDTLVVETTDFRGDDVVRPDMGRPIVLSQSARITERFTRTSHDVLLYQYTMDDPLLYTMPWRAEFEFRLLPHPGAVYEYACHEGNLSIMNALTAGLLGKQPRAPTN